MKANWVPIATGRRKNRKVSRVKLSRREFALGIATGLAAAGSTRAGAAAAGSQDAALTAYLDAAFEAELQLDPEQLTQLVHDHAALA